ncbi:MAG TPA: hypothetical protein VHW00_08860 [Thermoanaerobaculia bacterium]|nr:hypothetical protein [Thermoanaerobaculia bacterium]
MLKPVSILALDDVSLPLARAVQQRVASRLDLDDLVQYRAAGALEEAIQSIHAQRQRPESALRIRDDVSTRELVLVVLAASGPARKTLLGQVRKIRDVYESRRLATYFTVEILLLLPEVIGTSAASDYANTYALLKTLSAAGEKPFQEVWLLDAMNGARVRFGALDAAMDTYADAVAGALLYEPEMSGALPGIHPRGMQPVFSSFGYAQLAFPRDAALQRVEPRFAVQLLRETLLAETPAPGAQLAAKQFVAHEEFSTPLSRIGVEAGQSLFARFQAKTHVSESTRSAEELLAAVRGELQVFRDTTQLAALDALGKQAQQTSAAFAARLTSVVDATLDRHGFEAAIALTDALVDPLPDLRTDADLSPRNLITELNTATAALDRQLQFVPNTASSDAARRRIRELEGLLQDQKLVADSLEPVTAAAKLQELEREKTALLGRVRAILFAEERENAVARSAAREAEAARLAAETESREQSLREWFAQLPRAEHALREALEARRSWLWKQLVTAAAGVTAMYLLPLLFGLLIPNLLRIHWATGLGLGTFAIVVAFRYLTVILPAVTAAREALQRLREQLQAADQAKNAAHNDELRFEFEMSQRRAAIRVLRDTRDAAKALLDALCTRRRELDAFAAALVPASIASNGLTVSILDDAELDAWYERTIDDRKPFVREFPVTRSAARVMGLDELRAKILSHTSSAFTVFRKFTLGEAAAQLATEPKLTQRLKRFTDTSAPLIEVRDDDLHAQRAMQRDATLFADTRDAFWTKQLQRRFPDAQLKPFDDVLCVHAVTRVLHYPAYVLGQIEYYREQYEQASQREAEQLADLLPPELILGTNVRDAYEQVLLGRAIGVISSGADNQLKVADAVLGDSNLTAARHLAEGEELREALANALVPRLEIAHDVARDLRLLETSALTPLERNLVEGLVKKYASQA